MQHAFEFMQQPEGSSVYLRLSTRPLDQPQREISASDVINGAYWHTRPLKKTRVCIIYCGTVVTEVNQALKSLENVAVLAVTSPDVLYKNWQANPSSSHILGFIKELHKDSRIVTVHDSHSLSLSWIGAVKGHNVRSLGVSCFGQSGNCVDVYREMGLDPTAIIKACRGEQQ